MAVVQKLDPENEVVAKDMLKALEGAEEINKKIENEFSDTSNTWQGDAADKFKESVNTYVKEASKAIETSKEAINKILNAQDAKKEDQEKQESWAKDLPSWTFSDPKKWSGWR